jgi:hypothetical protein
MTAFDPKRTSLKMILRKNRLVGIADRGDVAALMQFLLGDGIWRSSSTHYPPPTTFSMV